MNHYRSAEFTAIRRSTLSLSAAAICVWGLASPEANSALVEPFSYSNGSLITGSGGLWKRWDAEGTDAAQDATVVNGAMRYTGATDVIRTFPAVLTGPGTFATISFSINVNIADTTEGYAIDFLPASAPFGESNTNYRNQFSLGFDYQVRDAFGNPLPKDGKASIDIARAPAAGPIAARGRR
jgi:hypothetical protein